MSFSKSILRCLNCEQSERETPLRYMHYNGEEVLICPYFLSALINASQKLIGKLEYTRQSDSHYKH